MLYDLLQEVLKTKVVLEQRWLVLSSVSLREIAGINKPESLYILEVQNTFKCIVNLTLLHKKWTMNQLAYTQLLTQLELLA